MPSARKRFLKRQLDQARAYSKFINPPGKDIKIDSEKFVGMDHVWVSLYPRYRYGFSAFIAKVYFKVDITKNDAEKDFIELAKKALVSIAEVGDPSNPSLPAKPKCLFRRLSKVGEYPSVVEFRVH